MPNPQTDDVIGRYGSSGWTLPTLTGQAGSNVFSNRPASMPVTGMLGLPESGVGANGGVGGVPSVDDALQRMLDKNAGATPSAPATNPFAAFPNGQQAWQDYQNGLYRNNGASASPFANILDRGADNASQSRLGVSGGVGSPFANSLGGQGGLGGSGAVKPPMTQRDVLQQQLDQRFGDGWSAQFTAQNHMDPISFYEREVPMSVTDPAARASIAMQRAGNDAQYHPNEIQDWVMKHGSNTPIPDEQWRIWSKINQGGGPDYNAGKGVDPYGVH